MPDGINTAIQQQNFNYTNRNRPEIRIQGEDPYQYYTDPNTGVVVRYNQYSDLTEYQNAPNPASGGIQTQLRREQFALPPGRAALIDALNAPNSSDEFNYDAELSRAKAIDDYLLN